MLFTFDILSDVEWVILEEAVTMTMNPMEDFLFHLKKYMEYTTEMRASYEHLSDHEQNLIVEASPDKQGPHELSKHAYEWHDELYKNLHK